MKKEFFKWVLFTFIFTFLQFIYVYIFFIEPNWIKVYHIKIVNPRLSRALSGIKIIQISDLHIENLGYREISLIEKVNKLKPDIILITGDMVGSREGITTLWNTLGLFEPQFHTYAIFGDSDGVIADLRNIKQWDKANTYLLDGKAIRINLKEKEDTAFWLVGAGDENLNKTICDIPKDEPVIFLSHRPDIIKEAAIAKIDLVLAGHTHGGQVGIPLLYRFFSYAKRSNYICGLYKVKDSLFYVNRGIGSEKSIRFFCRPEITVFEFISKGKMRYRILPQDR